MSHIKFIQEEEDNKGRFVILENDVPAGEMTYVWAGADKFIIDHTETFDGFSGKGYGKKLVMEGVEYARKQHVKIIPLCPFAKKTFDTSSEIGDVLF